MLRIKRLLVSSGVLGLLAAAMFAIPAQATEVKVDCDVSGFADVVDNEKPDMGVRWAGGDGHYTFRSTAFDCIGTEKGLVEVARFTFEVRSLGKYISLACGTGKARSTQGQSSLVPGSFQYLFGGNKDEAYYRALVSTLKYDVEFLDFQGEFFWHNDPGGGVKDDSSAKPATIPKFMDALIANSDPRWKDPNPPKEFVYAGHVALTGTPLMEAKPPGTDQTKATCVHQFTVDGVITIDV